MKSIVTLLLVLFLIPAFAQQSQPRVPDNFLLKLVAQNTKHVRRYHNGDVLKIRYHNNGLLADARGKLVIYNKREIAIIPYRKKEVVTIETDSISSIGKWHRKGRITTAVVAGTGAVAFGLAVAMQGNNSLHAGDGNALSFVLMLYAIVDLWYVGISVPAIFISEAVSVRSEKRGYHFFVAEGRN